MKTKYGLLLISLFLIGCEKNESPEIKSTNETQVLENQKTEPEEVVATQTSNETKKEETSIATNSETETKKAEEINKENTDPEKDQNETKNTESENTQEEKDSSISKTETQDADNKKEQNSSPIEQIELIALKVGEQNFSVELADTPETQKIGLMFREHLAPKTGMLFVFDKESLSSFWMKNTHIPLDVVWINAQKKVVDVQTLQPCFEDPCPITDPKGTAQYVLEVNEGEFKGKVGDTVEF